MKVLDFGLVREIARASGEGGLHTATGVVMGTPAYMSPEQARGAAVDHRSDLWSLGVVLYQMATGRLPFVGPTPLAKVIAVTQDVPQPVGELAPALPPALAALVRRLLEKDPAARPQSAHALAAELGAILAAHGAPRTGRRRAVAAGALVAVAALVAWVLVELWSKPTPTAEPGGQPKPAAGGPQLPPTGVLLIDSDDPSAEVVARKNGAVVGRGRSGELTLDAGGYTVELVEPKPGVTLAPPTVEVKKGSTVTVTVRTDKAAPAKLDDPDRRAADYTQSIGGTVRVNGEERSLNAAALLPAEPFRLTWIDLHDNERASDAGLVAFKGCTHVTYLDIVNTQVTDAGLVHFKGCKNLTHLIAGLTRIGDEGLGAFRDCNNLTVLDLNETKVTDAGLAHFTNCKNLTEIALSGTRVTDRGLANFKGSKNLTFLNLQNVTVWRRRPCPLRGQQGPDGT